MIDRPEDLFLDLGNQDRRRRAILHQLLALAVNDEDSGNVLNAIAFRSIVGEDAADAVIDHEKAERRLHGRRSNTDAQLLPRLFRIDQ